MSPVRNLSLDAYGGRQAVKATTSSKKPVSSSILLSEDIMALVTKEMDVGTAMKARSVNKSWKRVVKEANLEPLEAGASKAEQEQGRECQQHLEEALRKEAELWTPQYQDQLSQHLSKQSEVCVFVIALDRSCNGLVTPTSAGMAGYEGDEWWRYMCLLWS